MLPIILPLLGSSPCDGRTVAETSGIGDPRILDNSADGAVRLRFCRLRGQCSREEGECNTPAVLDGRFVHHVVDHQELDRAPFRHQFEIHFLHGPVGRLAARSPSNLRRTRPSAQLGRPCGKLRVHVAGAPPSRPARSHPAPLKPTHAPRARCGVSSSGAGRQCGAQKRPRQSAIKCTRKSPAGRRRSHPGGRFGKVYCTTAGWLDTRKQGLDRMLWWPAAWRAARILRRRPR